MSENFASARDGPALYQVPEDNEVSASHRLRAALAACEALLGDCARVAGDKEETSAAQMLAAGTAAKLASASALAASAIAKLADAETHQRLADTKIALSHQPRRPVRRASAPCNDPGYDASDWRAYRDDDPESENSTNNRAWPDE